MNKTNPPTTRSPVIPMTFTDGRDHLIRETLMASAGVGGVYHAVCGATGLLPESLGTPPHTECPNCVEWQINWWNQVGRLTNDRAHRRLWKRGSSRGTRRRGQSHGNQRN